MADIPATTPNTTPDDSSQGNPSAFASTTSPAKQGGGGYTGRSFKPNDDRQMRVIRLVGIIGVLCLVAIILCLEFAPCKSEMKGCPLVLLMIAAAAFALGSVIALAFTAFDEEEKSMFKGLTLAINGAIGGFTIADLSKVEGSAIRAGLQSLAWASSVNGVGLVVCVLVFFVALGFVMMFVDRQYKQKPALMRVAQTAKQQELLRFLTRNLKQEVGRSFETNATPVTGEAEKKAMQKGLEVAVASFKAVLNDDELFRELPPETVLSYAKACVQLGKNEEAEDVLRRGRSLAPDDRNIVFQLAKVLVTRKEYVEATALLRYLTSFRSARVSAFKLLGYSLLFMPGNHAESEVASRKYLAIHPEDTGAKLNLACAIGQHGPQENEQRGEMLGILRDILQSHPASRDLVVKLAGANQDFAAWNQDAEFNEVIQPFKHS